MKRFGLSVLPLFALAQLLVACGFNEPALAPITTEPMSQVPIPPLARGTLSAGAMVIDPTTHMLYAADGTSPQHQGVDIFDISTPPGRYLTYAPTGDAANGVVLVPDLHRLYVASDDGSVGVMDTDPSSTTFGKILDTISTSEVGAADLLTYDPRQQKVYVDNPDDGRLSAIDVRPGSPTIDTVVDHVDNLGLTSQPMWDPADGMIYVSEVDNNQMAKVDPRTDRVVATYPFDVPCEPNGIAVNPTTNQGIIACSDRDNEVTIGWDFRTEQVIRYFDLAGGGSLVTYDAKTDRFILAASGYYPNAEIAIFSGASPITYLTSVLASHRSAGVAYDNSSDLIYTYDGVLRQASLWVFPDPVAQCNAALTKCLPAGKSAA